MHIVLSMIQHDSRLHHLGFGACGSHHRETLSSARSSNIPFIPSTCCRSEYLDHISSCAALPISARSLGCVMSSTIFCSNSAGEYAIVPVTPSSITSFSDAVGLHTTGRPADM